jgi:hypothetical protein
VPGGWNLVLANMLLFLYSENDCSSYWLNSFLQDSHSKSTKLCSELDTKSDQGKVPFIFEFTIRGDGDLACTFREGDKDWDR